MLNELIFGAIVFFLGIFFLFIKVQNQSLSSVLNLVGIVGIGVGTFAFSHLTTTSGYSPKTPIIITCFVIFLSLILDRFLAEDKKTIRAIFALAFPFIFLVISNDWFHLGKVGFSGTEMFQIGLLGAVVPWVFQFVFSKFEIEEKLKSFFEISFFALFLTLAVLVSVFLGRNMAVFISFSCFYASYILMQHHFVFGKQTIVGFFLAFLGLVLFPCFPLAEGGIFLGHPSILLGIFLGVFLIVLSAGLSLWAAEIQDKIKAVGLSVFIIAILIIPILLLLILEQNIGIGGRTSIVFLLLSAALSVLFINRSLKNNVLAPITILYGLVMLLLPTGLTVAQRKEKLVNITETKKDTAEIQNEKTKQTIDSTLIVTQPKNGAVKSDKTKATGLASEAGAWVVDENNSTLKFEIDALGDIVTGKFNYTGTFLVSENLTDSKLSIDVLVSSINTDNEIRDESLRNEADFFEISKFPIIHFQGNHFEKIGKNIYKVKGSLKMKGISKTMTLKIKYMKKNINSFAIEGKSELDRTDYGMPQDASMSNEVNFEFSCTWIKKQ